MCFLFYTHSTPNFISTNGFLLGLVYYSSIPPGLEDCNHTFCLMGQQYWRFLFSRWFLEKIGWAKTSLSKFVCRPFGSKDAFIINQKQIMKSHEILNVVGWTEYDADFNTFWLSRYITSSNCSYTTTIENAARFHMGQVFHGNVSSYNAETWNLETFSKLCASSVSICTVWTERTHS